MSKKMTWEQIDQEWAGLQKRHRIEIAQAITRFCVGHTMEQVAKRLGYSKKWVANQLEFAGIVSALGGVNAVAPLTGKGGGNNNINRDKERLVTQYAPQATVHIDDDGKGNQSVSEITGEDAEQFEPYVEHYVREGHQPAAAVRLAKAEWAAECAVEDGVIYDDVDKKGDAVKRIDMGQSNNATVKRAEWGMACMRMAMKMRGITRELNDAKMSDLRRKTTMEELGEAIEGLQFQFERLHNLHPNYKKESV